MENFDLSWMPNPDIHRDDIDTLRSMDTIYNCFKDESIPKDTVWSFDGMGWSSQTLIWERYPDGNYLGEVGQFYISWSE